MRLKSLELLGFKSFVDRTIIHFEEGVTGIVGPNGCGKSNVVDAIRWTMGEQSAKHLRGGQMEDVIFNGTMARPPMGYAEARLTFDNADGRAPAEYASYGEIEVGRRLYRSGESEYAINKTPCRLRDVIDLFLGTGVGTKAYSIVEQGMIGAVISSKPEERRLLIEEAAGISKFKSRKEAALRKMEATRVNLARLGDIVAELTRQINSLQRQARKARRHQELKDELKTRELAVAATRWQRLNLELTSLEAEEQRLHETQTAAAANLSAREAEIETKRLTLTAVERELDAAQQELYAVTNTVKLHEASINHKEREAESARRQTKEAEKSLVQLNERRKTLSERLAAVNNEQVMADLSWGSLTETVETAATAVERLKGERAILVASLEQNREAWVLATTTVAEINARLESLEQQRCEIETRRHSVEEKMKLLGRRAKELERQTKECSAALEKRRQLKLSLGAQALGLRTGLQDARAVLTQAQDQLRAIEAHIQGNESRSASLAELEKNFEGYREGVKAVLRWARESQDGRGIHGTVGELFEIDARYERALAAALGERLEYVVVAAQETGMAAIDYLSAQQAGRGTFIPLSLRAADAHALLPTGSGIIGPLLDQVRMKSEVRAVAHALLGGVVLVEDVATARRVTQEHARSVTAVTLAGEVIASSGVVAGGSGGDGALTLVARRRALKEIAEELIQLEEARASARARVEIQTGQVSAREMALASLEQEDHGEELTIVGLDRDMSGFTGERTRIEAERTILSAELAQLVAQEKAVVGERETYERQAAVETQTIASTQAEVTTREAALAALESSLRAEEERLTEARVRQAEAEAKRTAAARELEQLTTLAAESCSARERCVADLRAGGETGQRLAADSIQLKMELAGAVQRVGELAERQRTLKTTYDGGVQALQQTELTVRGLRREHDAAVERVHEVALTLSELRGRISYLAAGIHERYHVELATLVATHATHDPAFDLEAQGKAVEELKQKLEQLGAVNVDAVREFEDLSARYDFLTKQHADLTGSLEALERAIARINRTSRARFRDTFTAVDEKFQMLFPQLFRGGRARLVLTDEDNLLESGVEIVASPPGKKLQSITLLSGGEKALTAVALIFSIFLIKPSPFCLLDEVDAPLDDANIDRFNDLIRSMTPHSQFILITHNKRTMELADLLYGVTMEEAGVSRMVSVKLNQENLQPQSAVA